MDTTQATTEVQTPLETERESAAPAGPETAVSQTRAHTRIQALCALCGDDVYKLHALYQYANEFNSPDDAAHVIGEVLKAALQRTVRDPEKLNAALSAHRFFADFLRDREKGPLNSDNSITELILEACSHEDVMGYFWTMYRRHEISEEAVGLYMRAYLERTCGEDEEKLKSAEQKFRGSRRAGIVYGYRTELRRRSQLAQLDVMRGDFDQLVQFGESFKNRNYEFEIKEELGAAIDEIVQPHIEQCRNNVDLLVALYNQIPVKEGKSKVKKALQVALQPILEDKKNDFDGLVELYNSLPSGCREETEKAIENTFPVTVKRAFDGNIDELSPVFEKLAKLHYELTNKLKETVRDTCRKYPGNLIKLARSSLAKIFLKTLVFNFDDLLEAPEAPDTDVVKNLLRLLPVDKSKRDLFDEVLAKRLRDMMQQFIAKHRDNFNTLFNLYISMSSADRKDYPELAEAAKQAMTFSCDFDELIKLFDEISEEVAKGINEEKHFWWLRKLPNLYEKIPPELKEKMAGQIVEVAIKRVNLLADQCDNLESLNELAIRLDTEIGDSDEIFRKLVDGKFSSKVREVLTAEIDQAKHDFDKLKAVIDRLYYNPPSYSSRFKEELVEVIREQLPVLIAQCEGDFSKLARLHNILPTECKPLMMGYIKIEQVASKSA